MLLVTNPLSTLMFLAGCGLLAAILLRRWSRYFRQSSRRRGSDQPIDAQPRPTDAWSGAHRDAHATIERQKVELYELAREMGGTLDSKMRVLQELISQSQRQIDRMEKLLGELHER